MAPDNFHLFRDLPQEIQDIVWEFCLPRRVISPCYGPEFQDRMGKLPGTRSRRDLPVHALIPFRPPLISRVCSGARATALRCGQHTPVLVREVDGSISVGSVWLNKKSDWVYFDYQTMMNGLDHSGAAPQVFELARDVRVPLLVDSNIQSDHEVPLDSSSQSGETIGSRLYKSFLKERAHFYVVFIPVILVVSGKGLDRVVETGLFGLLGEDTAIVHTADKEMLQRYYSLYNMYEVREASKNAIVRTFQRHLESLMDGGDEATNESWYVMFWLLKRICTELGEEDVSVEDMMNDDGSLKPDHPLVEQHGITMPTYETVVTFELRHLDTLLEDSATRMARDSTDTTDES